MAGAEPERGCTGEGQGLFLESHLTTAVLFLRCLQEDVGEVGFVSHMTVLGKCWMEEESPGPQLAMGTGFCLKVSLYPEMSNDKIFNEMEEFSYINICYLYLV